MRDNDEVLKLLNEIRATITDLSDTVTSIANHQFTVINPYTSTRIDEGDGLLDLAPEIAEHRQRTVLDYLVSKNLIIRSLKKRTKNDPIFDNFSITLGNNYDALRPLYQAIKKSLVGKRVTISLDRYSREQQEMVVDFASSLYASAFLTYFKVMPGSQTVSIKAAREPLVINFFTGSWLERYVEHLLTHAVVSSGMTNYHVSTGIEVVLDDGQDFELDLIVSVNDKIIWIECKTGDWRSYIHKYSAIARILCLPTDCAMLVTLETLSVNDRRRLGRLFNMSVMQPSELPQHFRSLRLDK